MASSSPSISNLNPFIDYIANEKTDDKLKDLFDFYDIDGNGMIQRQELIEVLSLCAHEINLDVEPFLEQIADAVFSNANLNQSGSITFEALKEVLKSRPNLTNELSLARAMHSNSNNNNNNNNNINQTKSFNNERKSKFKTEEEKEQEERDNSNYFYYWLRNIILKNLANCWESFATRLGRRIPIFNKLRWEYISNNLTRFNFFLTIILISLMLCIGRIITYWNYGIFLIFARCAGQCLNFLCSIIVLLVCRRSISLLRARGFSRYLPLDDHVYFHKLFGLMIIFHSLVHTFGHMVNFYLISISESGAKFTYFQYLFSTAPKIGWLGHCASLTGWLLLIIIFAMSLAHPFSRSLGKFELFYYTHLLYIPFWLLLFIHAPRYWLWFLGPFSIFLIETLIRLRNLLTNLTESGQTLIIKAVPLPSDVIHLIIKRPQNFEYNPGDWIYVLIPQIAKYEWHPFTISSAPEQEGVIWLHIRAVGEWTRCLRAYFENTSEHRNHLRRFIKSGQFSMSMDQQQQSFSKNCTLLPPPPPSAAAPLPLLGSSIYKSCSSTCSNSSLSSAASYSSSSSSIELSSIDSTQLLAANRLAKDKLSQRFKHSQQRGIGGCGNGKSTQLAPIPEQTTVSLSANETIRINPNYNSDDEMQSDCTQETNLSATSATGGGGGGGKARDRQLKQFCASSSSSSSSASNSRAESIVSMVKSTESTTVIDNNNINNNSQKLPNITIFIDGPYGSPSSQIFRAEHAVLIATGIGVTPFASILQSIVHHYEKRRQKCPNCLNEFTDQRPPIVCKLRKVDFVWINRDQKSFEWFIKLMAELELTQSHLPPNERFLDIHIHLTAMEPAKTKSIGLQLALYLVHEKNKKDLVTGLRTRTKAGRPNWDEFFTNIEEQKKGKVSVFFCGRPQLGRLLHRQCDSFGFKFRKEIF